MTTSTAQTPTRVPAGGCPRCGRLDAKVSATHPVCSPCQAALRKQAAQEQECCYLAQWLSSRADASGRPFDDSALTVYPHDQRIVARLVKRARHLGVDWIRPPAPKRFDTRLSALMAEATKNGTQWRGNYRQRGRPRRVDHTRVRRGAPARRGGGIMTRRSLDRWLCGQGYTLARQHSSHRI